MTDRSARFRRLRIGGIAAITGLCTAIGPMSLAAQAADGDATLTLSTTSVRPGDVFTASPDTDCPTEFGQQTVDFSFTDLEGTTFALGSWPSLEDGSWGPTSLALPVIGLDAEGDWQGAAVAPGLGSLEATCTAAGSGDDLDGEDPEDDSDEDTLSVRAASNDPDGEDSGDDSGDDSGGDLGEVTLTYSQPLVVTGTARQLSVSAPDVEPGGSITVTPAEACPSDATGAVVALVRVGTPPEDDDGEGEGEEGEDPAEPGYTQEAIATASVTTSAGAWQPVALTVPRSAKGGDHVVLAGCITPADTLVEYDAVEVQVGALELSNADCQARRPTVALSGTYRGKVLLQNGSRVTAGKAPGKIRMRGQGPWVVAVRSAATGATLTTGTVTCAPKYLVEWDWSDKTTDTPVFRVCNQGTQQVTVLLQTKRGKGRFRTDSSVDLEYGQCKILYGRAAQPGQAVTARIRTEAPGTKNDKTVEERRFRHHKD